MIRSFAAARGALAWYGRTALLLAAAGAAGVGALLPVARVIGPGGVSRLGFSSVRPWRLGFGWDAATLGPPALQADTVTRLVTLLVAVGAGVLAVAALAILTLAAARASARRTDVAVRRAVGASRRVLFVSSLVEHGAIVALTLAAGGIVGTGAAAAALATWPGRVNAPWAVPAVVAVAAVAGTIVVGGLFPLVFAVPRRVAELEHRPLELAVPALQLGASLTLLVAAGLVTSRAHALAARGAAGAGRDTVYEISNVTAPPARRAAGYAKLLRAARAAAPGRAASLSSPGAVVGLGAVGRVTALCGRCGWGGIEVPWHWVAATHEVVSADTFRTLGLPVVAGRAIRDTDGWAAPRVAVVNARFARDHFESGHALGHQVKVGRDPGAWFTVVGVVADREGPGFGAGAEPPYVIYLSVFQVPPDAVDLTVPGDAGADAGVRSAVARALGAGASVRVERLAALRSAEVAPVRWFAGMFGAAGWVLAGIAGLGTMVLMRLWVASLARELGLRRALGARRWDVLAFVLARGAGVAAGGIAVGLWLGLMFWGELPRALGELPPAGVDLVARYAALLAAAAVGAVALPAWRAARDAPAGLLASDGA